MSVEAIIEGLRQASYIASRPIAIAVLIAQSLSEPDLV